MKDRVYSPRSVPVRPEAATAAPSPNEGVDALRPDEARLRDIAWTAGSDGSFRLDLVDRGSVLARPIPGGYALSGAGTEGWRLEEPQDGSSGFVLIRTAGGTREEIGRTTRDDGPGVQPVDLLLEDGRLFRWTIRGPGNPRFELTGWEVPGAYVEAVRSREGWMLKRTVAGEELDAPPSLFILVGAELAHAEEDGTRAAGGRIDA